MKFRFIRINRDSTKELPRLIRPEMRDSTRDRLGLAFYCRRLRIAGPDFKLRITLLDPYATSNSIYAGVCRVLGAGNYAVRQVLFAKPTLPTYDIYLQ